MIEFHPKKQSIHQICQCQRSTTSHLKLPKANPTRLISATPYVNLKELMNSEIPRCSLPAFPTPSYRVKCVKRLVFAAKSRGHNSTVTVRTTVLGDESGAWRRRSWGSFRDNQIHMERIMMKLDLESNLSPRIVIYIMYFFASSFHFLRIVGGVHWSSESSEKKKKTIQIINLFAIFKMLVVFNDGTPFLISAYSSTVYLHHPCPLALRKTSLKHVDKPA